MATIYDWALSAALNANIDDQINWAEGQPPSSVNNSARSMMMRIRELVGDNLAGVATGSANAINLTIPSKISVPIGGMSVRFRAIGNNTGNVTLNLNNTGAKPVYIADPYVGPRALIGGELLGSCMYDFCYSGVLDVWFLMNPTQTQDSLLPAGMIASFGGSGNSLNGWLYCNGQAVSRTQFARLYSAIGTSWGGGNGSTTFNVPDLRGIFIRGWDDGRGIDGGRGWGSWQDSDNKSHGHSVWMNGAGGHNHTYEKGRMLSTGAGGIGNGSTWYFGGETAWTSWVGDHTHNFGVNNSGGSEARPTNRALKYWIKY